MLIGKISLVVLAFVPGLTFESVLSAETKAAGAQSTQAATESQTRRGTVGTGRPRKQRRSIRRNKCMPQSSSESIKSEETKPPTMDAPALILDPTDREPGPPKEIIPKHIDPAEMPSIKKPPKKKTKP